jgi:hypothetical protein
MARTYLGEISDSRGEPLQIGDRIYVAPRSYGGKGDVCVSEPIFDDKGEEIKKASIRGRITEVLWSEKHDCAVIAVDQPKGGIAVIYPELSRKQAGRTQAEKVDKAADDRAKRIKARRTEPKKPQLVVKKVKRKAS